MDQVSVRHQYRRMTAREFSTALDRTNLTLGKFLRLTGVSRGKGEDWLNGEEDIPSWVPVFMALLTIDAAPQIALAVAEQRLIDP